MRSPSNWALWAGTIPAWERMRQDVAQLRPGIDIITIEDFQWNFELTFNEMPTSMGHSTNSFQLAMFPVMIKYRPRSTTRDEIPPVECAAIVHLTPDLKHDHAQVQAMERR